MEEIKYFIFSAVNGKETIFGISPTDVIKMKTIYADGAKALFTLNNGGAEPTELIINFNHIVDVRELTHTEAMTQKNIDYGMHIQAAGKGIAPLRFLVDDISVLR